MSTGRPEVDSDFLTKLDSLVAGEEFGFPIQSRNGEFSLAHLITLVRCAWGEEALKTVTAQARSDNGLVSLVIKKS